LNARKMPRNETRIVAIDASNMLDRLRLCWGHINGWMDADIVRKNKEWLEKANAHFKPTTFIAYPDSVPAGMIEFLPQKAVRELGLCPCRLAPESREVKERYILGKEYDNYLFISCTWINERNQGKGIGKALLDHLLNSEVFSSSDGALVYVAERDEKWEKHIHWPAGPKEFYLKRGFTVEKTLRNPTGYLLSYRRTR